MTNANKNRQRQLEREINRLVRALALLPGVPKKELKLLVAAAMKTACMIGQCAERDWALYLIRDRFDMPTIFNELTAKSISQTLAGKFAKEQRS